MYKQVKQGRRLFLFSWIFNSGRRHWRVGTDYTDSAAFLYWDWSILDCPLTGIDWAWQWNQTAWERVDLTIHCSLPTPGACVPPPTRFIYGALVGGCWAAIALGALLFVRASPERQSAANVVVIVVVLMVLTVFSGRCISELGRAAKDSKYSDWNSFLFFLTFLAALLLALFLLMTIAFVLPAARAYRERRPQGFEFYFFLGLFVVLSTWIASSGILVLIAVEAPFLICLLLPALRVRALDRVKLKTLRELDADLCAYGLPRGQYACSTRGRFAVARLTASVAGRTSRRARRQASASSSRCTRRSSCCRWASDRSAF